MKLKGFAANYLGLLALCSLIFIFTTAMSMAAQKADTDKGQLYLVGLGSGDRDNMTLRAQKVLAQAEVVFAMRHLFEEYADLLQGKELHEAGHGLYVKNASRRGPDSRGKDLEGKNRRIIRDAVAAGKTVAIIAGGDPMLYGPHTGYLQEFQDLKPEVVPGLSSFNAANAALQKSVTRGKVSHSVILTAAIGSRRGYTGKDTLAKLSETQSSMVFFTMRLNLPEVVAQLKQSYPGDTPMAIVCHAGRRDQEKVILATVDTIVDKVKGDKLPFEHLIYVGDFLRGNDGTD